MMSGEPTNGFTVKELLIQVASDLKSMDGKLDGFIAAHASQHNAEQTSIIGMANDPQLTLVGRQLSATIADHGSRLGTLERRELTADAVGAERRRLSDRSWRFVTVIAALVGGMVAAITSAILPLLEHRV